MPKIQKNSISGTNGKNCALHCILVKIKDCTCYSSDVPTNILLNITNHSYVSFP